MNSIATETLSVVVEREVPFAPEKIWRALTQPHLIEETHLRMEHSGFPADRPQNYQGAKYGWQKFFANLERVLAKGAHGSESSHS
jgi:uncharacterized protein YndB with AHSA1/START domain